MRPPVTAILVRDRGRAEEEEHWIDIHRQQHLFTDVSCISLVIVKRQMCLMISIVCKPADIVTILWSDTTQTSNKPQAEH